MWNKLNNEYDTYYFKLPFTDEVIYGWNQSYPTQTLGTIILNAFAMGIFGNNAFFYINPLFASICVVFIYLIVNELIKNNIVAAISSLILFSMPVFVFWAIIPQNIMPSTTFLIMSLYFIVKFRNNIEIKIYLMLSGMFFAYSVFTRLPHILFLPVYLIYFFNNEKKYKLDIKNITYFSVAFSTVFLIITFLKIKYFGDPFFVGYLHVNHHPMFNGSDLITSTTDTYLGTGASINAIVHSIKLFVIGSIKIFYPLLPLTFLGFAIKNKNIALYKIYFAWILIVSLIYYGHLEDTLWKPTNSEYKFALSLAFFRYLLPVYVLSIVMLSNLLNHAFKKTSINKIYLFVMILVLILAIMNVNASVSYEGGANLMWYEEVNSKVIDYSTTLPNYIENDAVILYDTRNPLSYTYPNTMNYNWFYYDGVPPDYRYQHTEEVVEKLLSDNRTVYFVHSGSPYDELSKNMYDYLNENIQLEYIENTYFPRMKSRFYLINYHEVYNNGSSII